MRILIAEDEAVQRCLLEQLLKNWGHEVVTAKDGTEAWSTLQGENPPNTVILDWMMPGMDGIALCQALRARIDRPYSYVLLLTSKDQKDDLVSAMEAGADDYLKKPFDTSELKARLLAGKRILDLQDQLVSASTHDALTGILNRGAIIDSLRRELARVQRQGTQLGLILVDIDHFKSVNDSLGHLAGDAVLRATARTIHLAVRDYDSVGRYGGEEFLVVLPGCDTENAKARAEQIRLTVSGTNVTPSLPRLVTVSMGVCATCEAVDPDRLLQAADEALYRAKRAGRNRVVVAAHAQWKTEDRASLAVLGEGPLRAH